MRDTTDRVTITPQRQRGDLPGLLDFQTLHVQFVREPAATPAVYHVDRGTGGVFFEPVPNPPLQGD